MLSVIGGLAVTLGSSPLAAQTGANVSRSFEPSRVAPGGEVTVTITAESFGLGGSLTETLPAGFTYESSSLDDFQVESTGQDVTFTLLSTDNSFTYTVKHTASSPEGSYPFSGTLTDGERMDHIVSGDTSVTVSTGPPPTEVGPLKFDVVPDKAVKGAIVSGLFHPIGSNPLQWEVETGGAAVSIANGGVVGDFRVEETSEGSGKFQLVVMKSRAPALNVTQAISVDVTYEVDGADVTANLSGDITEQSALAFTNSPFNFTIPQSTSADTPIGAFGVSGGITDEYLDGIVSGGPFQVRDPDMTLVYSGSSALEVKTYTLELTVNGDAGLANRAIVGEATVRVTASNLAPSVPATFAETVKENAVAVGSLVSPDTEVGDASAGVSANDGDDLAYSLVGADGVFDIDEDTGMITVASDGISDSDDISYTFMVMVSDGISANNQYIIATVDIDVNDSTAVVADADLPAGVTKTAAGYKFAISVPDKDVPMTLFNLGNLVSDADDDDLSFDVLGSPSHIVYNMDTDDLLVTYLPPSPEGEAVVNTITVGVSDGFNGADTDDQTLSIEISITELQPAPITSSFVGITVAENSLDCSQDDVASGCSLAGVVSDATSFSIESGVDGGDTDYAVADDGTITVLNAPNYEDGLTRRSW